MAVTIDQIKYLPDLPAAGALAGANLLHLNQAGTDVQLTLTTLQAYFDNRAHPIGSMLFFNSATPNPNTLFPGQTWVRTLVNESLRGANTGGSNVNTLTGDDSFTIAASNLPAHAHSINLTTNTTGNHSHTATSGANGNHQHYFATREAGYHAHTINLKPMGYNGGSNVKDAYGPGTGAAPWTNGDGSHTHDGFTDYQGQHDHAITVQNSGNHAHTVTGNTANNSTTNTPISNVPVSRYVMAWVRTA